jgi:hypothetical protein
MRHSQKAIVPAVAALLLEVTGFLSTRAPLPGATWGLSSRQTGLRSPTGAAEVVLHGFKRNENQGLCSVSEGEFDIH